MQANLSNYVCPVDINANIFHEIVFISYCTIVMIHSEMIKYDIFV